MIRKRDVERESMFWGDIKRQRNRDREKGVEKEMEGYSNIVEERERRKRVEE